jgi:hypothetical protein
MLDESGEPPSTRDIFGYVVQYGMAPADMFASLTAWYYYPYSFLYSAYSFSYVSSAIITTFIIRYRCWQARLSSTALRS